MAWERVIRVCEAYEGSSGRQPSLKATLKMTWDRLDECYGAPEIIESSLFEKLDSFPKISKKDNRKLRELGDLLMELLSAKEDGYLPGLSYLDTAHGIGPHVEKLPSHSHTHSPVCECVCEWLDDWMCKALWGP